MAPVDNPYPQQIRALESIRLGLNGTAYFIETIFNPFKVAENLSSPAQVQKMMDSRPDVLLEALHSIAQSQANHAKRAAAAGAKGIFLAIANAEESVLSREDYESYSRPFDRMVFDAVAGLPLNTLHIHGAKVYLDLFTSGWPARVLQYSVAETGIPLAAIRAKYGGVLMGGIDELKYRQLTEQQLRQEMLTAVKAASPKFILAPGCSVPDDSTESELLKLPDVVGA